MSTRAIVVIILALVCGVSTAVGVRLLGGQARSPAVPVLVAKKDIARGRALTADVLEIKAWPKDLAPPHALTRIEDAVERLAHAPLVAGEPVLEAKLTPKHGGGLGALVPKGMRAYTIKTSRVASSVAGFALPGSKVDVLLSLRGGNSDGTGGGSTTTLLQAVEILAVDQALDAPAENKMDVKHLASVTLLVSPDQAALLDLGQNMGTLTLSLRNPDDTTAAKTQPATLNLLRFLQSPPVDAASIGERIASAVGLTPKKAGDAGEKQVVVIRTLRGTSAGRIYVTPAR